MLDKEGFKELNEEETYELNPLENIILLEIVHQSWLLKRLRILMILILRL